MTTQHIRRNDTVRARLAAARRVVLDLQPFSPSWDAAMAGIDDLEHQARNLRANSAPAHPIGVTRPV